MNDERINTLLSLAGGVEKLEALLRAEQNKKLLGVMAFLVAVRERRLRNAWNDMHVRCYSRASGKYHRYAGRGISICPEWGRPHGVIAFCAWAVANKFYPDLVLDRADNDGNYCPQNCQWVTQSASVKNREITPAVIAACRNNQKKVNQAARIVKVLAANSKPVIASNGTVYPSARAASRALGLGKCAVTHAILGYTKSSGGLTWKHL
jgi:hypothetical protein